MPTASTAASFRFSFRTFVRAVVCASWDFVNFIIYKCWMAAGELMCKSTVCCRTLASSFTLATCTTLRANVAMRLCLAVMLLHFFPFPVKTCSYQCSLVSDQWVASATLQPNDPHLWIRRSAIPLVPPFSLGCYNSCGSAVQLLLMPSTFFARHGNAICIL